MIAKGNLHGDGAKLALYLTTGKEGERAELIELRGFPTDNIRDAFLAAQVGAEAKTHSTRPFFHAYVRLVEGESLDREQWQYVADRIEKQLGFEGQPRALAFHHLPDGATHLHIAWSRHDLEHDVALDPGLYKLKLKEISRDLERELGLTRVRNEREPEQKALAPGRNEFEQARRLGTDLKTIRENIRECWDRSDNGKSFEAALAERGFILARGDKRDFVVIDPAGGDHALGKRITGIAAPGIRAKLADLDKNRLPGVDAAKELQAESARLLPPRMPTSDRAPAAAARPETPNRQGASTPLREAKPHTTAQERGAAAPEIGRGSLDGRAGPRDVGDAADRLGASMEKMLGAAFEAMSNMIAPPAPPEPEQQQRDMQAAEERAEQLAAQRARAEEDLRLRLEQQIKDDLSRERQERDQAYYRGRERER